MKTLGTFLALLTSLPAQAQEDARYAEGEARQRASEVRLRCAARLDDLPGLGGINTGGSGTDYRLVIVVRDSAVREAARARLGGDAFEGLKIIWVLSAPASSTANAPASFSPLAPGDTTQCATRGMPAPSSAASYAPPSGPIIGLPTGYGPPQPLVETRRTFYAGPYIQNPPGWQSRGPYGSNCSPSRGGFLCSTYPPSAVPCAPANPAPVPSACPPSAPFVPVTPPPSTCRGNNGVGNGFDPQPPGRPPVNDGRGTGVGNPGNRGHGFAVASAAAPRASAAPAAKAAGGGRIGR
jgi:hypothetical protein